MAKETKAKVYLDKAGIEKGIKSIASRGLSLDKDIQLVGESVLAHIAEHKEVSLFKKLYDSLPKGSRSNALVAWALAFGQIAVNFDKETKKAQPFLFVKEGVTNLEGAASNPWFDFKKPKDPADEFDPAAAFVKFMERIHKAIKDGKVSPTDELTIAMGMAEKVARGQIEATAKEMQKDEAQALADAVHATQQ